MIGIAPAESLILVVAVGYPFGPSMPLRPVSRYDSITFPSYGDGCKMLDNGKLRLQGVGAIKVKLRRAIEGKIKTGAVKREAGRWYAILSELFHS